MNNNNTTETKTTLLSMAVAASNHENELAQKIEWLQMELEHAADHSAEMWEAVADDWDTTEVACPDCGTMQEFTEGHREFVRKHHFISQCSDCA